VSRLKHLVRQALIKAEVGSGKCLASENFCIVIPSTFPDVDNIDRVMGYNVLVTVTADIQLVVLPHVKGSNTFVQALKIFNEEMKMQVNWYRNASEKDNDKPHGTGELLEILHPAQASECVAIIVAEDGNLVERILSLIKQADVQPPVNTLELESTINTLTSDLQSSKQIVDALNVELTEYKESARTSAAKLEEARLEILKLKKPKPVVTHLPKK
tara:strand:+ start:411 stop:1055 length:645 start_codon:yes stop_codon:yes gene_type:complete